tara:strand:- start:8153 stop:8986 length:834 start_codon:yes stop_codon:yes gene_type:complete
MNIKIRGNFFDLSTPKVMGILNLTPDSFYDGGKFKKITKIQNHVSKMIEDGMDILDIGGYSSKPGAKIISSKIEISRILPTLIFLKKTFPKLIISIDTFRSDVAKTCLDEGADIINDISSSELDEKMIKIISDFNCPYIMMHMRGNPQNMQKSPEYKDVVIELINYLAKKVKFARDNGIVDLVIDPGFGFGKTIKHNYQLLNNLDKFKILDSPMLVGFSRKSMIYKTLKTSAENSLNGTTCLNSIALMKGANILRVHDVKQAKECIILYEKTNNALI